MPTLARVSDCAPDNLSWLSKLAGRFIVLEGPDGSGKSTQLARLTAMCAGVGVAVCDVREPGGTAIGERIRDLLLDPGAGGMSSRCEMLLYMASRAQLVEQRIAPALSRGELVLADRFVTSTIVYQGVAGGIAQEDILAAARAACGEIRPDLVVIFDVDHATARRRMRRELDRIESRGPDHWATVRAGYLSLARQEPDRHVLIDAQGPVDETTRAMLAALRERFTC